MLHVLCLWLFCVVSFNMAYMYIFPLDTLNNIICIIDYNQILFWNKHVLSTAAIHYILFPLSHNCVKQRESIDSCIQIKRFVSTQCIPLFICYHRIIKVINVWQSELLGKFRLIGDRASDVAGGRICLNQNAYIEI